MSWGLSSMSFPPPTPPPPFLTWIVISFPASLPRRCSSLNMNANSLGNFWQRSSKVLKWVWIFFLLQNLYEPCLDHCCSWLLHDPDMKVRSNYPGYQDAVTRYMADLLPRVADLQVKKKSPYQSLLIPHCCISLSETMPCSSSATYSLVVNNSTLCCLLSL
jgi:hypothetical protein